jgi:hypothetical protein
MDGELQLTTDEYQSPSGAHTILYDVGGLRGSAHTLKIEVTGYARSSMRSKRNVDSTPGERMP